MSVTLPGGQVVALFLVLMRSTGFVVTAPIFGHRAVPATVKAGIAVALAVLLAGHAQIASAPLAVVVAAPLELVVGLLLGAALSMGLQAIEMVGRLVALQMGLSLGAAISPLDDGSSTAIDPLFSVLAGLTFLALNLPVAMVQLLASSFGPFPLGGGMSPASGLFFAQLTGLVLELAIRVAMPLALALLFVQAAVSLLARAIPQINVFILGMPVTMLAGLIVMVAALPSLAQGAASVYSLLFRAVMTGALP